MAGGEKPELRLGLVLYGGVSLAVYIYGVVVEVQRLLHASERLEGKRGDGGSASPGYAAALREAGLSRAGVDIISGTSAGGINGILLAKALATGANVDTVRDLWIERGDIGDLLRTLADDAAESLLSTKVMRDQLVDGFERLDEGGGAVADGPLDLFVSATHLRGDRRRFRDSLGHEIETLKHRYVFELKRRPRYTPPRDDFLTASGSDADDEANPRLVKLSRATSAFPVAFEPVEIGPGDQLLGPQDEPAGWFADGGILNNKPFTEALKTIFTRSSDRPVRRWLLSVDPDPKADDRPPPPGPQPGFDQIAVDAVAGIPRYQSIAGDLQALEDHNAAVRRANATVLDLERGLAGAEPSGWAEAPAAYRRLRRDALATAMAERMSQATKPVEPADFDPAATQTAFEQAALSALAEVDLERVDLAFELRRAYYLVKLIALAIGPGEAGAADDLDAVREGLWGSFELASDALWRALARDPLEIPVGGALGADAAFEPARERARAALARFAEKDRAEVVGQAQSAVAGASLLLPGVGPAGRGEVFEVRLDRAFADFIDRDEFMLPTEVGCGPGQRDLVQHAQISPATATSIGVEPEEKLAGDAVGHFGGFLEQRWRENDLLWGRLDAAEILVGAIAQGASGDWSADVLKAVHQEILAEEERPEAKLPDGQWQAALRKGAIGNQDVKNLEGRWLKDLGARAGFVLRGMVRGAARKAEAEEKGQETLIGLRTRILVGLDRGLKRLGRLAYPLVLYLRRRARRSER